MKKGFTLIELLIVIAIIAILAAVVFVALDPLSRFRAARDSSRWSDVTNLLGAIKLHQVDNSGSYLATISGLTANYFYTVGTCTSGGDTGCTAKTTLAACADLTALTSGTTAYIGAIPMDPSTGTAEKTDYYISRASNGVVTIGACDPEGNGTISVSR